MAMAGEDSEARRRMLPNSSLLEVFVPQTDELDVSQAIVSGELENISRHTGRRLLFFDENVTVILVLKTAWDEQNVQALLPRIRINLASHTTDAIPQGSGNNASASGKYDLTSKPVLGDTAERVLQHNDRVYVYWRASLHLGRPKLRLKRPAIYFTASLTVNNPAIDASSPPAFLKSFESTPANVLEPLRHDLTLHSSRPCFPGDKLVKVAPAAAPVADNTKPIRGTSARAYPAVPAFFTKVRYTSLPSSIIASLHVELSPLVSNAATLKQASLDLPGTKVELVSREADESLRPGDEVVLLYRITPSATAERHNMASIKVTASLKINEGAEAVLSATWQAQIDLSQLTSQPSQKWSRPLSGLSHPTRPLTISSQHEQRNSLDSTHSARREAELGVTFTFTGPRRVLKGETFQLDVQCINRSSRTRRFALVAMIPKKVYAQSKGTALPSTTNVDALAKSLEHPPTEHRSVPDVQDLNPDIKIGPLSAGASHITVVKYRATVFGVLNLGIIRVVDLETRRTVDVRDLPDVIAVETLESS